LSHFSHMAHHAGLGGSVQHSQSPVDAKGRVDDEPV
jgi:hypothetical protein